MKFEVIVHICPHFKLIGLLSHTFSIDIFKKFHTVYKHRLRYFIKCRDTLEDINDGTHTNRYIFVLYIHVHTNSHRRTQMRNSTLLLDNKYETLSVSGVTHQLHFDLALCFLSIFPLFHFK